MNNSYNQLTFNLKLDNNYTQDLEQFIDACSEAGALSVSIEDAMADTIDETPIYGEPNYEIPLGWNNSKVIVLLSHDYKIEKFINCLKPLTIINISDYKLEVIQDTDWVSLTQSQFEPIPIGQKLVIIPSWHIENTKHTYQNRQVIQLDPGLAFGTGSHPTTNLCLQWLEQHVSVEQNISLLDYGCGSGILAIAAAKLGASLVVGVDIDTQAVQSAQFNAQNNQVENTIANFYHVEDKAWQSYFSSTSKLSKNFDIVIANILANPLKIMAQLLYNLLNDNGSLILSGILQEQAAEIKQIYAPYILLEIWQEQQGWVCMTGRKN